MMRATRIVLEVLAPHRYYLKGSFDLGPLEAQLDRQVTAFAKRRAVGVELSFRFTAFPPDFIYKPGMDGDLIRNAVRRRRCVHEMVQIKGYAGQQIRSFSDWYKHALPPDRRERQWKEGRSEFELGREWTANGEPAVPTGLSQLLDSHEGTRGTVVTGGITQRETTLPFSNHGARCHDLALRAERDGCLVTICIEAKADESFGGTVAEELTKARHRPVTRFPERLDWLTRSLLGLPAFIDDERCMLSDVISGLPYQLFSAIGGTLLEAHLQSATMAIFVVHEFRTTATADSKLEANANALNSFLRLFNATNSVADGRLPLCTGQILGPISITERPTAGATPLPCHIPLFIGKIRTDRLG
jgi:hypothetical protein